MRRLLLLALLVALAVPGVPGSACCRAAAAHPGCAEKGSPQAAAAMACCARSCRLGALPAARNAGSPRSALLARGPESREEGANASRQANLALEAVDATSLRSRLLPGREPRHGLALRSTLRI